MVLRGDSPQGWGLRPGGGRVAAAWLTLPSRRTALDA